MGHLEPHAIIAQYRAKNKNNKYHEMCVHKMNNLAQYDVSTLILLKVISSSLISQTQI